MAQENPGNNNTNTNNTAQNHANRQKYNNKRYGYNKTYHNAPGTGSGNGSQQQQRPPRENKENRQDGQPPVSKKMEPAPARPQKLPAESGSGTANSAPYRKNNYHGPRREKQNVKVEETVDDIRQDLKRIEKEIELEIKEIGALKLGL